MKKLLLPILTLTIFLSGCNLLNRNKPSGDDKTDEISLQPATSGALPAGMVLVWSDEFNGEHLDRSKWSTNYYSTLDYYYKTNWDKFLGDSLPQPAMSFTGESIILYTDSQNPEREFWPSGRKVSSIQTYDWNSGQNSMDGIVGGFFEARIRRKASQDAKLANAAFWFDSPGPDMRYYIEKGNSAAGVEGIRPTGQVFEIDLCEYVTTEIVLHGNVDGDGEFQGNIGHYIIDGDFNDKWVVHSMLWTPAGLRFFIDGKLVASSWDPADIRSPNHWMNLYFGAYGLGDVSIEVDYIRCYQWDTSLYGELPDGGFEYGEDLFPWEGSGALDRDRVRSEQASLKIAPGASVNQLVYLDHSHDYKLEFWATGGALTAAVENITAVSGYGEDNHSIHLVPSDEFSYAHLPFKTNAEAFDHKKTVRVSFTNVGESDVYIDDVSLTKL